LPAYARDYDRASACLAEGRPFPEADLLSLLTGYVLAWLGESLRHAALPARLAGQAGDLSAADRRALLQWLAEVIAGLLPRYRALADEGRIELSVTPWSHPILPLLLDPETAREAMPDVTLPRQLFPGGIARCDWQIGEAVRLFGEVFGRRPVGCWPAEGGISEDVIHLLGRHGFRWTASGAQVLFNSLGERDGAPQLEPWMLMGADAGGSPAVFFRDDGLSDRIGFEYARWPAEDAVEDLLTRILRRGQEWKAANPGEGTPVLAIIMDGENAWEYYPENGQAFLRGLYRRLAGHPELELTTFDEALGTHPARSLSRLVAGSWVHGNFSTWIGDPAKNRAWELLARAKAAVDAALAPLLPKDGSPPPGWAQDILRQLAVCEASDWFWWLGPDNRLQDGPAFDRLYRQQLGALYALLGTVPPAELEQPLDDYQYLPEDAPSAQAGAMRQATE
jgi:alpha-amylase/alpha-mannosidase (GH57 family)